MVPNSPKTGKVPIISTARSGDQCGVAGRADVPGPRPLLLGYGGGPGPYERRGIVHVDVVPDGGFQFRNGPKDATTNALVTKFG